MFPESCGIVPLPHRMSALSSKRTQVAATEIAQSTYKRVRVFGDNQDESASG